MGANKEIGENVALLSTLTPIANKSLASEEQHILAVIHNSRNPKRRPGGSAR